MTGASRSSTRAADLGRIPLKNLREMNGKPLLAYPIELCLACDWIAV